MIWKNLMVLAGLIWFTASYAAHPVVAESIDDALQQKHEEPSAQKVRQRGVAEEADREMASEPKEEQPMKYWRYEESPTN
jgi:hypothetical protein